MFINQISGPAFAGNATDGGISIRVRKPGPKFEQKETKGGRVKKIYIAAYHQSKFGKLFDKTVPEIVTDTVNETCAEIGAEPQTIDVASVGATCNFSLNQQGLLAGLVAMVPGLGAKPIESVENACATGGQAVLSVIGKMQMGLGDVGLAVGFEKMRNDEGKMDGALIGEVLGYFSHPDEREGKVYIFPHLFAEVMRDYMAAHGTTEREFAEISSREYANGNKNPYAQMQKIQVSLDEAATAEGRNRYIVDGLPLKTYDCSQITDGYAGMILATEEGTGEARSRQGGLRRDRRVGAGDRCAQKRGSGHPQTRGRLPRDERCLRNGRGEPGRCQRGRDPRLLHGHGRDRYRGHRQGRLWRGRALLGRRQGRGHGRVRHQHLGRPHRQGTPGRGVRSGDDRLVRLAAPGQGAGRVAGAGSERWRRPSILVGRSALRSAPSSRGLESGADEF